MSRESTNSSQVLASPLSEPGANREGIKYILERAEWYWNLSALLLDPDKIDEPMIELQKGLQKSIVKLYQQLLLYQMKSVCLYGRSQPAVLVRDLVRLDDWKEQIKSIEIATECIRNNVSQFRAEYMSARLWNLDRCLKEVRTDLQAFTTAVYDFGSEQRKRHEDDKDRAFLNDLYGVDPRLEKAALEDLKGGLIQEAHDLVFEQSDFQKIQQDDKDGIIWITGGPGSGKTMFLCGLINQLLQRPQYHMVTYFLCRADRQKTRTAKSVLRGILWLICDQSWGITRRLREDFANQSRRLFEDDDAMVSVALEKMLASVLSKPSMQQAILVIDAIDECDNDSIRILIRVIGRLSRDYSARWIVSSRSFVTYRSLLSSTAPGIRPSCLELSDRVVASAVQAFVKHKVNELSITKGYDEDLRQYVEKALSSKASDTFLWVALVCLDLNGLGVEPRHVAHTLETMPKELNGLYGRMLTAALDSVDGSLCREVLPLVCVASRPLTLDELRSLVPGLKELSNLDLRGVFANCGPFLSIQIHDSSSDTLNFIHESAREYLAGEAQHTALPLGVSHQHRLILTQALANIKDLTRNLHQLPFPGSKFNEIRPPVPDPLSPLRYSCLHWLDHAAYLQEQQDWHKSDDEMVESFICNDLLHWLEALSLMNSIPQGTAAFQTLSKFYRATPRPESPQLGKLVEDARRFILYNKACIEAAPLQVYASALLFCPQGATSEIKRNYQQELDCVALHPIAETTWSQIIQELPSSDSPMYMAFSNDGRFLVTGDAKYIAESNIHEHCVEIWDVLASHRIHSVQVDDWIRKVAFSHQGNEVLVVQSNGVVRRLETDSGRYVSSFKIPGLCEINTAVFSPEGRFLALKTLGESLAILDSDTAEVVQSIDGVLEVRFSPDNLQVVTWLSGGKVALWRIGSTKPVWAVPVHARDLAFLGNKRVAIRCRNDTITIRSTTNGSAILVLPCHPRTGSITWLGTGLSYISWCYDQTIKVFDNTGTKCLRSLPTTKQYLLRMEHEGDRYAFSPATNSVAWAGDTAIRLWDLHMGVWPETIDDQSSGNRSSQLSFSQNTCNDALLASWSNSSITTWTAHKGKVSELHTLSFPYRPELLFSPDGKTLVACAEKGFFQSWDTAKGTGSSQRRFADLKRFPCFSPDGRILALALGDRGVEIWECQSYRITGTISQPADQVLFSHDGQSLVISWHGHIEVWAVSPPRRLHMLDVDYEPLEGGLESVFTFSTFSPDDRTLAVVTNKYVRVWTVGDAEPRCRFAWTCKGYAQCKSVALSPDGNFVAIAVDFHVWIWHLSQPVVSHPLYVELPNQTKTCRFSANSRRLVVKGGAVILDPNSCVSEKSWAEAKHKVAFRGYGLSQDRVWIMKDNQKLLYLPREFRPRRHPKTSWADEVAFMDSTVAIASESGRVHFLRFHDNSVAEDSRWCE